MSKLRWNSKQLLSKQFDSQSNTSNKSLTFEKFGRSQRNSSFVQQKQTSAVKKLKRSSIINRSHLNSKSSTSIMCDVKKGKMKFTTNILKTQEYEQKPQKMSQKKKFDMILDQVYIVLKDVQSLFTEMKNSFKQFRQYTIQEYKKISISFTSLNLMQSYQPNVDKISKNYIYSTLEALKTENTLCSTKNVAQQPKNKVIILTANNQRFVWNNVRKTQSLLTYAQANQDSDLNRLSPNKKIQYQERPVFQSLRSKITKRSNITEKVAISHSQIPIQQSPRFIKTPRKKSVMFSSSSNQIPNFSRLSQSAYSNREASPAVKQVQHKIDMAIKTMKNAIVNK